MKHFFSSSPIWQTRGMACVRVVIGLAMIYHGCEMFDNAAMQEYLHWDPFKNGEAGKIWVYAGKFFELINGLLLFLGFLTRVACLIMIGTMLYIAFVVGHGKVWYEDQYPFLFVIIGIIFIFTGPGAWSLDQLIFKNKAG